MNEREYFSCDVRKKKKLIRVTKNVEKIRDVFKF